MSPARRPKAETFKGYPQDGTPLTAGFSDFRVASLARSLRPSEFGRVSVTVRSLFHRAVHQESIATTTDTSRTSRRYRDAIRRENLRGCGQALQMNGEHLPVERPSALDIPWTGRGVAERGGVPEAAVIDRHPSY